MRESQLKINGTYLPLYSTWVRFNPNRPGAVAGGRGQIAKTMFFFGGGAEGDDSP